MPQPTKESSLTSSTSLTVSESVSSSTMSVATASSSVASYNGINSDPGLSSADGSSIVVVAASSSSTGSNNTSTSTSDGRGMTVDSKSEASEPSTTTISSASSNGSSTSSNTKKPSSPTDDTISTVSVTILTTIGCPSRWSVRDWRTNHRYYKPPATRYNHYVGNQDQRRWWTTNDVIIIAATRSPSTIAPTGANRLVCRCLRYFYGKWDLQYTKRVLKAYLQFLVLKYKVSDWHDEIIDCPRMSSVYLMWQVHVSDTSHYKEDCLMFFEHYVDHIPDDIRRNKVRHGERVYSHIDRMKYTLMQLLTTFPESDIDQGIWMIGDGTSITLHKPAVSSSSSSSLYRTNRDKNQGVSIPKIGPWWIDGGPRNIQFSYPNPNLQLWWLFDGSDEQRQFDQSNNGNNNSNNNEDQSNVSNNSTGTGTGTVISRSDTSTDSSESNDSLTYTLSSGDATLDGQMSISDVASAVARTAARKVATSLSRSSSSNSSKQGTVDGTKDDGEYDDEETLFGEHIDLISDDETVSTNDDHNGNVDDHLPTPRRLSTIDNWDGVQTSSPVRLPRSGRRRMASIMPIDNRTSPSVASNANRLLPCDDDILNEIYEQHQRNEALDDSLFFFDGVRIPDNSTINYVDEFQPEESEDSSGGRHMLAPTSPYLIRRSPQAALFVEPELPAVLPGARAYRRPPTTPTTTTSTTPTTPDSSTTGTGNGTNNNNNNNVQTSDSGTPNPQGTSHSSSPLGCWQMIARLMFDRCLGNLSKDDEII